MYNKIENLSESKKSKYLRSVIAFKTRHTLSDEELDLIVDHMNLDTIVKIVILPNADWAASKLSVKRSFKKGESNEHQKTYSIEQSFLPGPVEMGDRDEGTDPVFNPEKPFAVLMKCVHCGVTKQGNVFSCDEYELVIYVPHVNDKRRKKDAA